MTETQQRFLRAIAERVPKEQVVEVHLFPAIRQGGVETGVAVVAEQPRALETSANGAVSHEEPLPVTVEPELAPAEAADSPEAEAFEAQTAPADPNTESVGDPDAIEIDPIATDLLRTDEVVAIDAVVEDPMESNDELAGHLATGDGGPSGVTVVESEVWSASAPQGRLTVHTARYRLTLKGVDRGKWEVDVVAEADAPLSAVDAVVRGVQRRGGEGTDPDRLTGDAFRDALEAPLATLER